MPIKVLYENINGIKRIPFLAQDRQPKELPYTLSKLRTGLFSGNGYIAGIMPGIVLYKNLPSQKVLELRERKTRRLIDRQKSNLDGTYRFNNLNEKFEYDIIAFDEKNEFNDVIMTRITPWLYGDFRIPELNNYILKNRRQGSYQFKIQSGKPKYEIQNLITTNAVKIILNNNTLYITYDGSEFNDIVNGVHFDVVDALNNRLSYSLIDQNRNDIKFSEGNKSSSVILLDDRKVKTQTTNVYATACVEPQIFEPDNYYIEFTLTQFTGSGARIGFGLFHKQDNIETWCGSSSLSYCLYNNGSMYNGGATGWGVTFKKNDILQMKFIKNVSNEYDVYFGVNNSWNSNFITISDFSNYYPAIGFNRTGAEVLVNELPQITQPNLKYWGT